MTGENSIFESADRSRLAMRLAIFAMLSAFVPAVLAFVTGIVFEWSGLGAFTLGAIPFTIAGIFAFAAVFHAMLAANAAEEEHEKELLRRRKESKTSILDVSEDVRFTAGRTFANYCKYFPFVFAAVAVLVSAAGLWYAWLKAGMYGTAGIPAPKDPLTLAFVCAVGAAFALFAGAFLAGQSRVREFRWLRPAGAWMVFGAAVWLIAAVPAVMLHYSRNGFDLPAAPSAPAAKLVYGLLILLTAELIFNFISEFYRPRTQIEERPVYESRLLALFIEPGSVAKNIAAALDYQFGFKISGTTMFSAFCRVALPVFFCWLLALWAFTMVSEVASGELGIKTRFGAAVPGQTALKPGLYFKLPWPCEDILRVKVEEPMQVVIGQKFPPIPADSGKKENKPPVVLWTKQHAAEEMPFLVANDSSSKEIGSAVSLLNVGIPVVYHVDPKNVLNYAFRFQDVPKFVYDVGTREATNYFASTDFMRDLSTGREATSRTLAKRMQNAFDKLGLGITIYSVNLENVHPPVEEVAPAFQDVFCAQEEMGGMIEKAKAYRSAELAKARISELELTADAKSYRYNVTRVSQAEALQFRSRLAAYNSMPRMFKLRTYLDFLETDCGPLRKYIVAASIPYQILELNAEEKPRLDLMDADLSDLK